MTTKLFRSVGIGYRDGSNYYLKFSIKTIYKNPIVVSATSLLLLAEGGLHEVIVYEREPQKRLDLAGTAFEEGWTVNRIGKITPSNGFKSLRLSIRKLPDFYISRNKIIQSMVDKKSIDIVEVIKE